MECPHCGKELMVNTMTCPHCGSTWSGDDFTSRNVSRTDTEYRLALGGHRMVTSRRDLKSFMVLLIVLAVMAVAFLVIDVLGIEDDFSTYLGFIILSAVAIVLARDFRTRRKTYPGYSRFIAVIIAVLIIGLTLALTSKWLLESVSPTGGSVTWYNDTRSDYQSVVYSGLLIGGIAAACGLISMASRSRIIAWMDSGTSDRERING